MSCPAASATDSLSELAASPAQGKPFSLAALDALPRQARRGPMPYKADGAGKPYNARRPVPPELRPAERCAEQPPKGLLDGIEQFNRRDFFEGHETLEAVWNAEPGPIRTLYKGILQVGVGCYHLLRHNYRGATLKLQTGADYLEPYSPRCMG